MFLVPMMVFFASVFVFSQERLDLKVGELHSVLTNSPYRISISDPAIADITSATNKEILIIGKSPGNTILNIWDKWGKQTISVDVYLENLSSLQERIKKLLNSAGIINIDLKINPDENKIIVDGTLKDTQKSQFELLIDPFKEKVINLVKFTEIRKSVLIDVNILELDKSAVDKLGIDWPDILNITFEKVENAGSISELFKVDKWGRDKLTNAINLLVQNGEGRILSRPKLVCLSGQEAEFLVGGQVPVVTTVVNETGTSVNVEYKNYGVSLKIKPTVEGEDGVRTSLTTEISEIDLTHAILSIPAFLTRKASTELYIKEGQTIFLAGLLKNKDQKTISRVPAVGDIPIIGHLFRSRDFVNDQTELVITLSPTIIDSEVGSELISTAPKETKEDDVGLTEGKATTVETPREIAKEKTQEELLKELNEPISQYAELIYKAIREKFFYPADAKENKESGTAVLSLHINANGEVVDIEVSSSSGSKVLDASAISLVKDIAKFGVFPASLPLKDLWVNVPIEYHLE